MKDGAKQAKDGAAMNGFSAGSKRHPGGDRLGGEEPHRISYVCRLKSVNCGYPTDVSGGL